MINLFVYKPYCVYPSPDLEAGKSEDFFEEIKLLELAEVITKNLSLENNPGFFKTFKKMASHRFFFFHFPEIFDHKKIRVFLLEKLGFFLAFENKLHGCLLFVWPFLTNQCFTKGCVMRRIVFSCSGLHFRADSVLKSVPKLWLQLFSMADFYLSFYYIICFISCKNL